MTTAQKNTYQMLREYVQSIKAPGFLTGFFRADGMNAFHNQKQVQIDITLEKEVVAVPVSGVASDYNRNDSKTHQELEVTPPVFKESEVVPVSDLYDRQSGMNPYESNDFQQNGVRLALQAANRLVNKVGRALELQASQILTTGAITTIDSTGATVFSLNYNLDSNLFPTATTPWSTTGTADPLLDLGNLCRVIRQGGNDPIAAVFDAQSFEAAMKISSFEKRFTAQNVNVGALNPMTNPGTSAGQFRGRLMVENWWLDVYTYGAMYVPANTSTMAAYVPRKKVIVLSGARMDATFGSIPRFPGDQQALQYLPGRISASNSRMDLSFNAWFDASRTALNIGVGTRPLLIPTDKYAFGCLDTDLA